MATYVTLPQAQDHLREYQAPRVPDLTLKLEQAEALILEYVTAGRTRWLTADDPPVAIPLPEPASSGGLIIQACILEYLAYSWENRGDTYGVVTTPSSVTDQEFWNAIARKLARLRDPAVA